jgi:hypothetical protein
MCAGLQRRLGGPGRATGSPGHEHNMGALAEIMQVIDEIQAGLACAVENMP